MKISNNANNTSLIMTKNAAKVQEDNMQTNEKRMEEQSVKLSISNEGRAYYRNSIQQNGQETYDDVLQRREQLISEKISVIDYGYVAAYAELYDEIIQGYEAGTREIYVADENGTRKLTMDEELSTLDAAYKKTVDDFVTMEKTNQHAREIISEEMDKISKITSRSTLTATYIEEQKTRGTDKVSENLNEKMLSAVASFKEKYAAFNLAAPNDNSNDEW